MTIFQGAIKALARCNGYTVSRIFMSVVADVDSLEIGFRWGPDRPDIAVSFKGIYYASLGKTPGADALYVDKISAVPLPTDGAWPERLPEGLIRTGDMPSLLWIRAEPLQMEIVAAIVNVLEEVG